jgi:hypothetical protein
VDLEVRFRRGRRGMFLCFCFEDERLRDRQDVGESKEREGWVFGWAVGEHQFWGCNLSTMHDSY